MTAADGGERYDFVLVRPEYAPQGRQGELARHILDHVVKPGGRLIVLVGNEEAELRAAEQSFLEHGFSAQGSVEKPHPGNSRLVRRLFWIENSTR
jgi:hypothetical protein